MEYKRERDFLQSLCKDYILELIEKVGWDNNQKNIIKLRYIDMLSVSKVRTALFLTSATYARYYKSALIKLQSYINCHKDIDWLKYY